MNNPNAERQRQLVGKELLNKKKYENHRKHMKPETKQKQESRRKNDSKELMGETSKG